jgi:sporulation protein YlmC with PRC-barrel domain
MRLRLRMPVDGVEGEIGVLADLVVDPDSRRVTHLVVEPRHRPALARLVPVDRAIHEDADDGRLSLLCSTDELRRLPEVHELAYGRLYDFPVEDPDWDVGITEVLAVPAGGIPGLGPEPVATPPPAVIYDRVPKGEVELRSGSPVIDADERQVGRVAELVSDDDDRITALVVRRAWFKRPRRLTIPARDVARVEMGAVILRVRIRELRRRPHATPGVRGAGAYR